MLSKIPVDDATVVAIVRDVIARKTASAEGQGTYLRTLVAAVQVELGQRPRLVAGGRGRVRKLEPEAALAAVEATHKRFYAIVLAEIDPKLDALVRNAQSAFARSAVSTLRTAVRLGLNPLEIVAASVTKDWLRAWTRDHKPDAQPTLDKALQRTRGLMRRLSGMVTSLSPTEQREVMALVNQELSTLVAEVHPLPVLMRRAADVNGHQRLAA
jgi:hypothetical protein